MALTFSFEKRSSPVLGEIYRPVAKVFFYSSSKKHWYGIWMIVDTGADYSILPKHLARILGVNLQIDCQVFKTAGVGGAEKVFFLKSLKARLGKWERNVPVGFLNRDDIPPLLGRHLFLESFNLVLSSNHQLIFSAHFFRLFSRIFLI